MRVAIVGAGFGGIGLGIQLRRAGIESFTIFDRQPSVGGVWFANSYPGLTCDIPSHLYSFSYEPNPNWSRRFAPRDEILAYLEGCVDRHGLREHLRLGTEVAAAELDEERAVWRLRLGGGEEAEAEVLVTATGQLSRPAWPDIPGLDRFGGEVFHSARWNHDFDMRGRRVAALGTGASAVQYVPAIAPLVERLHVFQRSPGWLVPKPDRAYRPRERALFARLPWLQRLNRRYLYERFELIAFAMGRAPWMMRPYERGYLKRVEREIPDPALRAKLVPDYPMGCKRVLVTSDWLPTLARPNVELVSDRVREVTEDAVVTGDGVERAVDAIVLGTGFRATELVAPMTVRGRGGVELNEVWRAGPEAYLGLAVSGFPNMFVLYGPHTNLGSGSITDILEAQARFVVEAVRGLAGRRWMDVRPEAQAEFVAEVERRLRGTVWTASCNSWYRTESGRVTNNWPGPLREYQRRTRRPEPDDFTYA